MMIPLSLTSERYVLQLKLSFMIHADNSYLAEPYIGYLLREYFRPS